MMSPVVIRGRHNGLKCSVSWGFTPDPSGGVYSASPDPLARFRICYSGCLFRYFLDPPLLPNNVMLSLMAVLSELCVLKLIEIKQPKLENRKSYSCDFTSCLAFVTAASRVGLVTFFLFLSDHSNCFVAGIPSRVFAETKGSNFGVLWARY